MTLEQCTSIPSSHGEGRVDYVWRVWDCITLPCDEQGESKDPIHSRLRSKKSATNIITADTLGLGGAYPTVWELQNDGVDLRAQSRMHNVVQRFLWKIPFKRNNDSSISPQIDFSDVEHCLVILASVKKLRTQIDGNLGFFNRNQTAKAHVLFCSYFSRG